MTLKPSDMLMIQTAIDDYQRKYPRKPAPSAKTALHWRLGRRATAPAKEKEAGSLVADQECNRLVWIWQQFLLYLQTWERADHDGGAILWVRRMLLVSWWGILAVAVASVFFFGALVGGFK